MFCELILLATGSACIITSTVLLRAFVRDSERKIASTGQVEILKRNNSGNISSGNIFLTIAHYVMAVIGEL